MFIIVIRPIASMTVTMSRVRTRVLRKRSSAVDD